MNEPNATPIEVGYPALGDLHLRLAVGACRIRIRPGDGPNWVSGTYTDPSGALPCQVSAAGGSVDITQTQHLPEMLRVVNRPPEFALSFGRARPFALTIESGASEIDVDLGGVPLHRCLLRFGAGRATIGFSAPNPEPLAALEISAGAAGVTVERLADANCEMLRVEGGAAAYSFDFGGTLQRDLQARISAGLSSVDITVPGATAARIASESTLGSVEAGDGFTTREGAYWTAAAVAGATPSITVRAGVTLGALRLRAT